MDNLPMKRLFTLPVLILLFCGAAVAQTTFSLGSTQVWTIAPNWAKDTSGHTTIQNLTTDTIPIKWERFVINITPGCETQVCDINLCYLSQVSTKTFKLAGGLTGNLIMHFINEDTILGANGLIHLKLTNLNLPSDTATITFLFTSSLSGTGSPLPAASVKLFPNPTTDYFRLDNADDVRTIRVFSLDSREVARFDAAPGEQYRLNGQPAGTYMVVLEDNQGRVFQAIELVKK